jgi:L-threonylcarbamoyladenylate synthase
MLEQIVDVNPGEAARGHHRSPGVRYGHYAPSVEVHLWEGEGYGVFEHAPAGWCYIGMRTPPEGCARKIIFDTPDDYAHGLFGAMRELEKCGATMIIADLPDDAGLGEAVRNRLTHAANARRF